MHSKSCLGLFLLLPLLGTPMAWAQQDSTTAQPDDNKIYLDVVVTRKSGPPVTGLQQQDFTLLDNKVQQPIRSFRALSGSPKPIEVLLVVDEVNTSYESVAYERNQIDKFLRANEGRLAYPTAIAFFTRTGMRTQKDFTSNGNALSAAFYQTSADLPPVRRATGYYGATERVQMSLNALGLLAEQEAPRPGRKVIIWISPGWPLLSSAGAELASDFGPKQDQKIFENIVSLSTQLRQARITLYSIDPLGTGDIGIRTTSYEMFLKGVSKPSQAHIGDLGLQVLATQSGGLALSSDNDLASLMQKCLDDTQAYYEISFDPPHAGRQDEYHHLEIHLAKPGLTVRTRQSYYAHPTSPD